MTLLNEHAVASVFASPSAQPSVRSSSSSSHTVGRVAAIASALACMSGIAAWVGGADSVAGRDAGADELLASAHFGAATAQLRAQAAAVTKQLYAAEDKDAKTGFRVSKDQALVRELEQKAERISAQLKGPDADKPAREMMLASSKAFASVAPKPAAGWAREISLSDMGAIIKAVKEAEGQSAAPSASPAQPINVNIYLPGGYGMAAAAAAPKAPSAAELVQEQAKKSASLRLQLMAQDQQIHKLLDETKPQQAATDLSSQAIEATLASAVSDMSTRLHATNPIKEAAQLGVADPVDYTESAAMGLRKSTVAGKAVAVTAALKAPAAPQTAAQAAAAKAAHLKKVLEIDGLLLKGKKQQVQLKSTPAKYPAKLKKARTQELADGSAQEQLASAEAKEESMQHHHQLAKALKNRGHIRQQKDAGDQVDHPTLDQEESNSFFGEGHVQNGVRLPDQKATKLKYAYRSQMHKLDQAAGDAETMKITGSIRDLIPESLFHALNRQNVIHDMNHPRTRVKGFPSRRDSDTVFGHSIDGGPAVPSDHDVIKENNRMLSGLELAAGYKSPKARKTSSAYSGDGWGQHHVRRNDDKGWNSKQWLGGAKVVQDEVRPLDDDSIPVLSDGWGQHDGDNEASVAATAAPQGLAGWKKQLKSSEQSLGMRGLMAKQMGMLSKHTQLQDAQRAASDGWLR